MSAPVAALLTLTLVLFGPVFTASAQDSSKAAKLETLRVAHDIYMLVGPDSNLTVQLGEQPGNDGILLVDTQSAGMSERILAEVRKLSEKPIRYIVNTSADPEHAGGNAAIAKTGKPVPAFRIGMAQDGASVFASENVLTRMSSRPKDGEIAIPAGAWPTLAYSTGRDFYFNGEPVQAFHVPSAHTDGDSIVFFRNSNVISAGEIFITTGYPVIDLKRGGSIQGEIKALNRLLELAVPADNEEGGTMIVPGRGRICDEADVSDYRDMITIIRDRVSDMIAKGKTLDEVKAAQPTLDYDGRYSRNNWTGVMFTEAIYNSLVQNNQEKGRHD